MMTLACIFDGGLCVVAACGVAAAATLAVKKFKEREKKNDSTGD